MRLPRHRLDSGTWGVMGIGMGYAIAAAVETGAPVVAIEGDSAFGFSGMELETICRYDLPVTVVVLNNGGVYRGDAVNSASADPAPTVLDPAAHHERLIEAFGGTGYHATHPGRGGGRTRQGDRLRRARAGRLRARPQPPAPRAATSATSTPSALANAAPITRTRPLTPQHQHNTRTRTSQRNIP